MSLPLYHPRTLSEVEAYCVNAERRISPLNTFERDRNSVVTLLNKTLIETAPDRTEDINKTLSLCAMAVESLPPKEKTDNVYRTLLLTTLPYFLPEDAREPLLSSRHYATSYAGDARLVIQGMNGDVDAQERMHMTAAAFGILACTAVDGAEKSHEGDFNLSVAANALNVLSRCEQQTKAATRGFLPVIVKIIPFIKQELASRVRDLESSQNNMPVKGRLHAGETLFINGRYLGSLKDHTNTSDTLQAIQTVLRILTVPENKEAMEFPMMSESKMTVQSKGALAFLSLKEHALTPDEATIMEKAVADHGGALLTVSGSDKALKAKLISMMRDDMGFQPAHTAFADYLKKPSVETSPSPF